MKREELSRIHFRTSKAIWREFSGLCPQLWTYVQTGRDPEEGVITGGGQAWSNPYTTSHTHIWFCLGSQSDHLCRPTLPCFHKATQGRWAGAKPSYVCVRVVCVCVWMALNALYCTVHTQSRRGDDWALVMLCKFPLDEDLLSITEGWRPAKGRKEKGEKERKKKGGGCLLTWSHQSAPEIEQCQNVLSAPAAQWTSFWAVPLQCTARGFSADTGGKVWDKQAVV